MDHLSVSRRCRAFLFVMAMLAGCDEREEIFLSLALVIVGLDFPQTQEALALCRNTNDEACLKAYRRVKEARDSLFSRPRKQALQLATDTIRGQCGEQQANFRTELTCTGAVVSLHLFSTLQDDLQIRELLDDLSPSALQETLASGGIWLRNRENKLAWREWVVKSRLSVEGQQAFLILLDMPRDPELTIDHLGEHAKPGEATPPF